MATSKQPKERRPFCFIDGEGADAPDGSHEYLMLCAYSKFTGERVLRHEDNSRLPTREIFEWLLDLSQELKDAGKPHVFVGFHIGYDLDMWTDDLEEPTARFFRQHARMLHYERDRKTGELTERPGWVSWGSYIFRQIGSEFMLRDAQWGEFARESHKENPRSVSVWDIAKFYQSSFLQALEAWQITSDIETPLIEEMKAQRSAFTTTGYATAWAKILRYCLAECRMGEQLIQKLDATCVELGYPLRAWHGAGSLAAAMLKAWGIKSYLADVPDEMNDAVSCAYFGGRFEISGHGRTLDPVYQYDINSAYPTIIRELPCLACATWEFSKKVHKDGVYEVQWQHDENTRWGAFPHRNGSEITYPLSGSGWYWGAEILAAQRWHGCRISVVKGWRLSRRCNHHPFARVSEVYAERLKLGKSAQGLVLKLGLNSLYGKMAQSVGSPAYANYIWAGMVTAGTRAMLLDAIREAGANNVLMCATDAVFSLTPIPALPCGEGKPLGQWEMTEYRQGMMLIQPGVFVGYGEVQRTEIVAKKYKTRGMGKHEFYKVLDAIEKLHADLGLAMVVRLEQTRFVGWRSSLHRNRYHERNRWITAEQKLSFYSSGKREFRDTSEFLAHIDKRLARSHPIAGNGKPSDPYDSIRRRLTGLPFDELENYIMEQPSRESERLYWRLVKNEPILLG